MPTEAQKDRVILDLIDDLLKPEPLPKYEPHPALKWIADMPRVSLYVTVFVSGFIAYFLGLTAEARGRTGETMQSLAGLGLLSILLGGALLLVAYSIHTRLERQKLRDLEFAQQIVTKRTEQRAVLMEKLTAAETQKYASMGHFKAQDFQRAQMKEQRQWEADEAKKVRDHELEKDRQEQRTRLKELRKKIQGELQILESRIKIENPPASVQNAENLEKLKGRKNLFEYANTLAAEAEQASALARTKEEELAADIKATTALQMHEAIMNGKL